MVIRFAQILIVKKISLRRLFDNNTITARRLRRENKYPTYFFFFNCNNYKYINRCNYNYDQTVVLLIVKVIIIITTLQAYTSNDSLWMQAAGEVLMFG